MESETNTFIAMLESMDATRWTILGVVLFGAEMLTGTTYILWPAAAAILVGLLTFLAPGVSWELQFILFFALSTALLVFGHYFIRPKVKGGEPSDLNDRARAMVGARVKAVNNFDTGRGRVQVGDTQWAAAMEDGNASKGDELRVTAVKGATLWVEKA